MQPVIYPFVYFQLIPVPLTENDQNQPLINTGRKRMYRKDLGHFKESNQQPNNLTSEGQGSEQLWGIQAARIERDVIPYVTQLKPPIPGRKGV